MGQEYQGILISLEKRMPMLQDGFEEPYSYIVYGYYDGMDVRDVSEWGKFRPAAIADLTRESTLDDGIYDRYTIRACYPSEKELQRFQEEYGLCYDMWRIEREDCDFPFISCIMLHLTKECVKSPTPTSSGGLKKRPIGLYYLHA